MEQKKIKILMVLGNTHMGGAQAFVLNVLRNINTDCFRIDFAINFYAEHDGIEDECRKYGCEFFIIPYFNVRNYFSFKKTWNDFFESHYYDIVYAHSTNSASIFLKIAKEHGIKTIAHSHSAGYRGGKIEKLTKKFFAKNVGKVADYWFACSDKAAERLYGKDYRKYPYYYDIPNAIDVEAYHFDESKRAASRISMGVADDTFLCGHVGTFSAPKNHVFLMDIFREVLVKKPNAKLVCCGAGALMYSIKEYAKEIKILDNIIFTGVVRNANEYMMAMDAFVFPSVFEGFPVSILEAQAAGLHTVMSDVITKEVDVTELIHRANLKQGPKEWADMVLNVEEVDRTQYNKVIADSKYNIKDAVRTFEKLYTDLVNS